MVTSLSFVQSWLQRLPKQTRLIFLTAGLGLGAALATAAFQASMNVVYRVGLVAFAGQSTLWFICGSFAVTVGSALFVGWLVNTYCPEAAGSGVPQLKFALWRDFGFVRRRVAWVKFVAGVLQIGGGSSLGREGPSVQLAGAIGSNLAGLAGVPKQQRRHGAATGAAAGLAAAFNTPLAAVTFVLEELIGDLNSRLLGSILLAAMIGALVTHGIFGPQPAFTLTAVGEPTWRAYLLVPVVAVAASLVGFAFQKGALGLRKINRSSPIPPWMRPAAGACICWAIGTAVFLRTGHLGVFGLGYDDLSDALAGKMAWTIAALLLFTKFVATVACYGTGGAGGIFSPTLFFGAMTGIAVAGAAHTIVPLNPEGVSMLAIIGMSATLGVVVRAPVTSILIVFEMTHQFALVPPLMLGALISQTMSHWLLRRNFYDALLEQDGHEVERFAPPRDLSAWHRQSVSALANTKPVLIPSLDDPSLPAILEKYPYHAFPVLKEGAVAGAVTRADVQAAVKAGRLPFLHSVAICSATDSIKDAERAMVECGASLAVIVASEGGTVTGVITLHDLLRAQLAASDRADAAL